MLVNDRFAPRLISLAAVVVLFVPACKKAGSDAASAPASYDGGDHAIAADDDPLAKLDALEGRMTELGLPVASAKQRDQADDGFAQPPPAGGAGAGAGAGAEAGAVEELGEDEAPAPGEAPSAEHMDASQDQEPSRDRAPSRCDDLCSLNEAICDLEVRICEMSDTHGGDPTYAEACERAIEDCATSGDACDACHS